jgi:REP element-mobilizing transposase RayT
MRRTRRFYDFLVWSERKRVKKLRYMHRNPVKDGLVQAPEQWPWSRYRSYAYNEEGVVRVNRWAFSLDTFWHGGYVVEAFRGGQLNTRCGQTLRLPCVPFFALLRALSPQGIT